MIYALASSSPRVSFAALTIIAAALAMQMNDDLAPLYDKPAWTVVAYKTKDDIPAPSKENGGVIVYELVPKIDEAPGALAYHTEDSLGRIWGREGVDTILDDGGTLFDGANSISSAASHEMCETFGDASVSSWEMTGSQAMLIAREVSDPCEGDFYPKSIGVHAETGFAVLADDEGAEDEDGAVDLDATADPSAPERKKKPAPAKQDVAVSNFVLEAYFDPQSQDGPYDFMGKVTKPGEIRPGGYQMQLTPGHNAKGQPTFVYQNIFGHMVTPEAAALKLAKGRRVNERMKIAELAGFAKHKNGHHIRMSNGQIRTL